MKNKLIVLLFLLAGMTTAVVAQTTTKAKNVQRPTVKVVETPEEESGGAFTAPSRDNMDPDVQRAYAFMDSLNRAAAERVDKATERVDKAAERVDKATERVDKATERTNRSREEYEQEKRANQRAKDQFDAIQSVSKKNK